MHPQLSAYPLIALLKQHPKTSLCRRTRRYLQTASRSSKSLPSSARCRRHEASPQSRRYRRLFHTQHRPLTDHRPSTLNASLSRIGLQQASQSFLRNQRRGAHSGLPSGEGQRVAVIGGGISGLASAFNLARRMPKGKITLYESSDRLGGWLQTKHVNVGDGTVIFEQGPRTLQTNTLSSLFTFELIQHLGIEQEILPIPRSSLAGRNRFLYYPDRLVKMPGGDQDIYELLWSWIVEPIYKGSWNAFVHDVTGPGRDKNLADESISSFFNRRFGSPDITNNMISAVIHGIYAGDIDKLSIKSLFPKLWELERDHESIFRGVVKKQFEDKNPEHQETPQEYRERQSRRLMEERIGPFANTMKLARTYSFRHGIGTLSKALENALKSYSNVELKMNEKVTHIKYDTKADGLQISTASNHPPTTYTQGVCTLPASTLATLTPHVPSLKGVHSVTVMVVNLFYRSPGLIAQPGFGYLIPRSIPFSQNPECALGVVFDSSIAAGEDTIPGTRISVIIGGHYWDYLSHYPDEEEGARMAKNLLKRHLGIDEEPGAVMVGLHRNCIPQYYVGHGQRVKTAKEALRSKFNKRLYVTGSSYGGVGVNDCVRGAYEVTKEMSLSKGNHEDTE